MTQMLSWKKLILSTIGLAFVSCLPRSPISILSIRNSSIHTEYMSPVFNASIEGWIQARTSILFLLKNVDISDYYRLMNKFTLMRKMISTWAWKKTCSNDKVFRGRGMTFMLHCSNLPLKAGYFARLLLCSLSHPQCKVKFRRIFQCYLSSYPAGDNVGER